jgi:hypothetical protein
MQRNKPERMMNQSMPNLIKEKSINPKRAKGRNFKAVGRHACGSSKTQVELKERRNQNACMFGWVPPINQDTYCQSR